MTNDFKKDILDYITNNVTQTSGSNIPIIENPILLDDNSYNILFDELPNIDLEATYPVYVRGYIFDENTQNTLFYGSYWKPNNKQCGFVYIANDKMEKVAILTTLTSGSELFPIISMNQSEDGTMYALGNGNRVLLFNNILIPINNQYIIRLRQSYIIPGSNSYVYPYQQNTIRKVYGEATYYIVFYESYFPPQSNTRILEFKINVGSDNEWNVYTTDNRYTLNRIFSVFIEKNGSNIDYYFYSTDYNKNLISYKLNNGILTKQIITYIDDSYYHLGSCIFAKNKNDIYVSWRDEVLNKLKIARILNNQVENIKELTYANLDSYPNVLMYNIYGVITINIFRYQNSGTAEPYMTLGIVDGNNYYFTDDFLTNLDRETMILGIIIANYNLIKMFIPVPSGTQKYFLDYNPLNYNGLPYSNYNQTKAVKGRLYSNNEMVFARNLYNTTLLNNSATHTVNVPNTLLNGTEIDTENLIGETNTTLVSKTTTITKNIYENLYINFINTINVLDEDTNKYFQDTATYINQNVNIGTQTNCEDTFVGKVNINFTTPITQNIIWTWNTDHYETSFTIDCRTEIPSSIDFISNDLSTIYLSKIPNITVGSYYTVSQKLRIE